MAPWEKYASQDATAEQAPWTKYGGGDTTSTPTAPQQSQNMAAFAGGNLSKGVADVAGLPVDLASSAIEGVKGLANLGGAHLKETQVPVGGSEWIKQKLAQIGSIGPSAEPRTPGQQIVAKGLEAAPSAVLPGSGNALSRVGAAVGSGMGGEVGRRIGGTPGQIAGALVGGGIGGLAGIEKGGLSKPPSEAARASKNSGIPLTLGQETGNTALKFTENRLRELFPSKGVAHEDELKQVAAGIDSVNRLADRMSSTASGDHEQIGNELRTAYTNIVKKIVKERNARADEDFAKVRAIAGDKSVIGYRNTLDELNKIISENKNVPVGDAAKIRSQAEAIKDALRGTGPGKIDSAMKTRRAWSRAAARTGNIFSDIDPNLNQVMAKRLFAAINRDFDAASQGGRPISQALKVANRSFQKASQSIDFVKKSALGKLLGEDVVDAAFSGQTASTKAPELIAKRYLSMTPSQARTVTSILRQHDPDVLNDVKAFVLRNGLEQAKNDVPGAPPISFAKFRSQMDKVQPKLKEMGFTDKEIQDIEDVTDTMARAGDKTGANPSGTTGAGHMLATATAIGAGHPLGAAVSMTLPYITAKALLTQSGRDLLRQSVSAATPAARAAAAGALRSQYGVVTGQTNSQPADSTLLPSPPR